MKSQPAGFRSSERQQEYKRALLFVFNYDGDIFCLTNFDNDLSVTNIPAPLAGNPQAFTACQIHCDTFDQATELNAPKLNVGLALTDNAASQALRALFITAPGKSLTVTIAQVASNALPAGPINWAQDCYVIFVGIKMNIIFQDFGITAAFNNLSLQKDGMIPAFFYSKTCQYMLYGPFCQVNPDVPQNSMTTVLTAANRPGGFVTIAENAINGTPFSLYIGFQGGILEEYDADNNIINTLTIISNQPNAVAGTNLYMLSWSSTMKAGTKVKLKRGCARVVNACSTFPAGDGIGNNVKNFGGQPYIPDSNPGLDGIVT